MPGQAHQALVALRDGATSLDRRRAMAALRGGPGSRGRGAQRCFRALGLVVGPVDWRRLPALRRRPEIHAAGLVEKPLEAILPDAKDSRPVRPGVREGRSPTATWGVERLGVRALWQQGLDGTGVVIGHLDTGLDEQHPALRRALAHRAYVDALGRVARRAHLRDTERHGTHTAATLCGRTQSGHAIGIAPGAKLASAVVMRGGNPLLRVLGGLDWLVRLRDPRLRVVSLSLGFPGSMPRFRLTVRRLRAFGILPVAAVGNDGPRRSRSPANVPETLGVGAMDRHGAMWARSSSQHFQRLRDPVAPDLVAPGVDIASAAPGGALRLETGTSMAVPHVAGLAALLFGARPEARVGQVEQAILASCRPLRGVDRGRQGHGLPHAPTALERLLAMDGPARRGGGV